MKPPLERALTGFLGALGVLMFVAILFGPIAWLAWYMAFARDWVFLVVVVPAVALWFGLWAAVMEAVFGE